MDNAVSQLEKFSLEGGSADMLKRVLSASETIKDYMKKSELAEIEENIASLNRIKDRINNLYIARNIGNVIGGIIPQELERVA